MADIYAGAVFTIAATWSNSSESGCFSKMQEKFSAIPLGASGLFVRLGLPRFPRDLWTTSEREHDAWPLLDRAWVFQERYLSARMVHFGKEQLYWECDSAVLSEDGVEDLKRLDRDHFGPQFRAKPNDPIEAWRAAVLYYSSLNLTYESDRLPAISAVVKAMQAVRKNDVYVAGMWRNSLPEDLSWRAERAPEPRPDRDRPTWSWISISGKIIWFPCRVLESAAMVKADFEITGPSHFGYSRSASITIKGAASTVGVTFGSQLSAMRVELMSELPSMPRYSQNDDPSSPFSVFPDFGWNAASSEVHSGDTLAFVLLWKKWEEWNEYADFAVTTLGILLQRTNSGQYRRVGHICIDLDIHGVVIASLPIKTFTVV